MTRVVFMGTPAFAVPALTALRDAFDVVGVVTQPDRPCGRGREVTPPPVKLAAQEYGLPLHQPCSLRSPDALGQLATWMPDVIVVAAFGHILQQEVLDLPAHGCLNVHASLLPRWRGAAPTAAAILAGDAVTGVTIMRMDAGLDTGPVLAQREEPIRDDDTRLSLEMRLATVGAELLVEVLPPYVYGDLSPVPQSDEGVTFAPCLTKGDGLLDWRRSAVELGRRVRAFSPWPGTFTWWGRRRLNILQAAPLPSWRGEALPGTVVPWEAASCQETAAAVATGEGALRLETIQLAGKRPMGIDAFLQGQRDFVGSRLAQECG